MAFSGSLTKLLNELHPSIITAAGLVLSTVLGVADHSLIKGFSLSLFYLIPIALVAWYAGRLHGTAIAIYCSLSWVLAGIINDAPDAYNLSAYVDAGTRLAFYLIVALLVAHQRNLLERERSASRTDFLTGALNRRAFYEIANAEIERSRRHHRLFTVTCFDLDDFKTVNDQFGHVVGDDVLRHVVTTVMRNLRSSDSIARMGGDEFVILLPEAGNDAAHAVVDKMRTLVLEDMKTQNWPVTLSIGVLVCDESPLSIDSIMRSADALMYRVKKQGKNSIAYSNCRDIRMDTIAR